MKLDYIMACMEDNYVGRRIAYLKEGVRFNDFCWSGGFCLAYHHIPSDSSLFYNTYEYGNVPADFRSFIAIKGDANIHCSHFEMAKDLDGISFILIDNGNVFQTIFRDATSDTYEIVGQYVFAVYDERNL